MFFFCRYEDVGTDAGLIPVTRDPEGLCAVLLQLAAAGCRFDTERLGAAGIPTHAVTEMAAAAAPLLTGP